VKCYNR